MDYVLQVTLSLIGVLGLILLAFYGIRKLNKGVVMNGGRRMKILDRINLGQDKMMLVVSVCGKCMVVGATSHRIEKICDLSCTEEEYLAEIYQQDKSYFHHSGDKKGQTTSFFAAMTKVLAAKAQGRDPFEETKTENRYAEEENEKQNEEDLK